MHISKDQLKVKPLDSDSMALVKRDLLYVASIKHGLLTSLDVSNTLRWLETQLNWYETEQDDHYWLDLWSNEIRTFRQAISNYPEILKTIVNQGVKCSD